MTTLVRLTSSDSQARFDNQLNADFMIEQNSSVALQNVVFEVDRDDFAITPVNDTITYSLQTGQSNSVRLNNAIYTSTNTNVLLKDIQDKLNGSLAVANGSKNIGGQWKVAGNTGKITVQYNTSPLADMTSVGTATASGQALSSGVFRKRAGGANDLTSYLFYDRPITRGCGVFRARVNDLPVASGNGGIVLALSTTKPTNSNMNNSNVWTYAISIDSRFSSYVTDILGTTTATAEVAGFTSVGNTNNDVMEIAVEEGEVRLRIYRNNGAVPTLLGTSPYDVSADTELYPVVYVLENPNCGVSNIRITTDPYLTTVSGALETEVSAVPRQPTVNTTGFFDWGTLELASFLGYTSRRLPEVGTTSFGRSLVLTATNTFDFTDLGDNFVILLDSLELDSYDTLTKERKSILATIPASDANKSVIYDAKFPNFVRIRNRNRIQLRNVKARILKNDLSPILTKGLTTMTLLFKDRF